MKPKLSHYRLGERVALICDPRDPFRISGVVVDRGPDFVTLDPGPGEPEAHIEAYEFVADVTEHGFNPHEVLGK